MSFRRVSRREIYSGRVFDLAVDRFREDGGDGEFDIEIVIHNGGAAILPVDADGSLVLVRQWRYVLGRESLEIPAGRVEAGDDPEATARRELEEEAGLSAATVESIGSMLPAPGYPTERIHLYVARDLTRVPPRPDEDERIEPVRVTLEEALAAVDDGTIDDAKTVIALLRYAARR
jgi:ADP-ribose pyrophosphatase